jgi:hypothetical protein
MIHTSNTFSLWSGRGGLCLSSLTLLAPSDKVVERTTYVENGLEKSISLSEQIFEQVGGVSGASRGAAGVSATAQASAGPGVVAGFDVPAQAAFRRNVLDVAQGQPHLAGRNAGAEGLVRGAASDPCQDQRTAQDTGVSRAELVVHKPPKVTDSHE